MLRRLLVFVICLLMPTLVFAQAGTLTLTSEATLDIGSGIYSVTGIWTSDASGAVNGHSFTLIGKIVQIKIIPDSGSTQPTSLFDLQITDTDGASLLIQDGVDYADNLSNSAPTQLLLDPAIVVDARRKLDIAITNAGNAKSGTIVIWIER